ncbi:MAG: hypothetical protein HY040_14165 [Planctomycetes bacterium]|nr:hypothetical protein [Planctomycetota bacterium]
MDDADGEPRPIPDRSCVESSLKKRRGRTMGVLHNELRRAMEERWTDGSLMTQLLRYILRNRGLSVSDEHHMSLVHSIMQGVKSVELPGAEPDQTIAITDEDVDRAMHELETTHEVATGGAVMRVVEELSPRILQSLYNALPQALQEWHGAQRAFEERLHDRWKEGLNRLDMLITMAHEAGEMYLGDLQHESTEEEVPPEPLLMNVLTALHCRACRTAREIVCLLKAGYADGAHARWRSLQELAVTAQFLLEHQGDTSKRYLDHAAVERFRAALEYQQHCETLGYDPCSAEEMAKLKKKSDAAIAKYGASFREDYGWAAEALDNPRPTFTQIEASLDMAHWRPWFRLACKSVHAGSHGLHFALGLPEDTPGMLLAGASDAGLTDPGHLMAISLTMVTVAFLTAHPNLDGLVACHCMLKVCDDIGMELLRGHEAMAEKADASFDQS